MNAGAKMEKKILCLEITVFSAEGLQIPGFGMKKNAFVTVGTDSTSGSPQATSIAREGGSSYPCWNEKLQLLLPSCSQSIHVGVHCKTSSWRRTKKIGSVTIPMSEILNDYVPADRLHFLSYRLRKRDGEANGIINLSIRKVGGGSEDVAKRSALPIPPLYQPNLPVTGSRFSDGIAIGIPVSYGYQG